MWMNCRFSSRTLQIAEYSPQNVCCLTTKNVGISEIPRTCVIQQSSFPLKLFNKKSIIYLQTTALTWNLAISVQFPTISLTSLFFVSVHPFDPLIYYKHNPGTGSRRTPPPFWVTRLLPSDTAHRLGSRGVSEPPTRTLPMLDRLGRDDRLISHTLAWKYIHRDGFKILFWEIQLE